MSNTSVHKIIEIVGSDDTVEGAINLAISTASKTLNKLEWFKVVEIRGNICDNKLEKFQVVLNVGFRLDDGQVDIDHHVAPKQVILPTSPAKDEQRDFIAEGGNSQPLAKPEK